MSIDKKVAVMKAVYNFMILQFNNVRKGVQEMTGNSVTDDSKNTDSNIIKVSTETLEEFVGQYSPEFVQGYFHALKAFCQDAHLMAYEKVGNNRYFPLPDGATKKNVNLFHTQIHQLLKGLDALGITLDQPTTDKPKLD